MNNGWILIIGFGSIGRRHFQNLQTLGVRDVRLCRSGVKRPGGFDTPEGIRVYHDLESALKDRPWVVVVANPTTMHVDVARRMLECGCRVILEKPLSHNVPSARSLLDVEKTTGGLCSMGYCFRFHPQELQTALEGVRVEA